MSGLLPLAGRISSRRPAQGQSVSTIDKERQLAAVLSVNRDIVSLTCRHRLYYHFDLNAGSGFNEKYQVIGSPLVFVELFEEAGLRVEAFFWDRNEAAIAALADRLHGRANCHFFAEDNCNFDRIAKSQLNYWSLGSVLMDPNQWLHRNRMGYGCPPIPRLAEFFRGHPQMDFIANMNVRAYQMMHGAEIRERDPRSYTDVHGPSEFPKLFSRK